LSSISCKMMVEGKSWKKNRWYAIFWSVIYFCRFRWSSCFNYLFADLL